MHGQSGSVRGESFILSDRGAIVGTMAGQKPAARIMRNSWVTHVRRDREPDLKKLRRWILELRVIRDEVRSLLLGAKIFWEVQRILEANPSALSHRLFNDWMMTNHGIATGIGIRRQLDKDSRSVSLKKLLIEIEETLRRSPDLLSRSDFLLTYRPELKFAGDAEFSRSSVRTQQGWNPHTSRSI